MELANQTLLSIEEKQMSSGLDFLHSTAHLKQLFPLYLTVFKYLLCTNTQSFCYSFCYSLIRTDILSFTTCTNFI